MTGTGRTSHAEQHLGDRLAALVDGELEHDARERVLAHLATCCQCKTEADEQRQLKSAFAATAPPLPSEGLLARLQGLPGADGPGPGSFGSGDGLFGVRTDGFAYVQAKDPRGPGGHGGRKESGFRIHDVERSGSRGRRFAFAAAGAVSLAALTLGGTLPLEAALESQAARGDETGAAVAPAPAAEMGGTASVARGDAVLAASGSGTLPFFFAPANVTPAPASAQSPFVRPPFADTVPPTATVLSPLATGPLATAPGGAPAGSSPSREPAHLAVPLADPAAASTAPAPTPH